jgi:hypothetical protein
MIDGISSSQLSIRNRSLKVSDLRYPVNLIFPHNVENNGGLTPPTRRITDSVFALTLNFGRR